MPAMVAVDQHFGIPHQRYDVTFQDGTSIGLHPVFHCGAPVMLLRALRHGNSLIVFDLSKLCRDLAEDLPKAHRRDVHGTVYWALRTTFKTSDDAVAKILATARHAIATDEPERAAA